MKTKTTIVGIDHEDLVDLFSTALYGSYMLGCDYDAKLYKEYCEVNENDCLEDKLAKILLSGHEVLVGDLYAEDEDDVNGTLNHEWDKENGIMWYEVRLEDIKKGIQKMLDHDESYYNKCAMDLVNADEGNLDLPEAENIMQMIVFGDVIYG